MIEEEHLSGENKIRICDEETVSAKMSKRFFFICLNEKLIFRDREIITSPQMEN